MAVPPSLRLLYAACSAVILKHNNNFTELLTQQCVHSLHTYKLKLNTNWIDT